MGYFLSVRVVGSPPHIRGKQRLRTAYGTDSGLIPAHTGNTESPRWIVQPWEAHPRAYGEHGVEFDCHDVISGSPPRIRGTHSATSRNTQPKTKIIQFPHVYINKGDE